jgi:hypothetical protein
MMLIARDRTMTMVKSEMMLEIPRRRPHPAPRTTQSARNRGACGIYRGARLLRIQSR